MVRAIRWYIYWYAIVAIVNSQRYGANTGRSWLPEAKMFQFSGIGRYLQMRICQLVLQIYRCIGFIRQKQIDRVTEIIMDHEIKGNKNML